MQIPLHPLNHIIKCNLFLVQVPSQGTSRREVITCNKDTDTSKKPVDTTVTRTSWYAKRQTIATRSQSVDHILEAVVYKLMYLVPFPRANFL